MSAMNLRPPLRYRLKSNWKSLVVFYGIMILLVAAVFAITLILNSKGKDSESSFSAYSGAAWIMSLVLGITCIREDLRVMIQNGIGRRTVFTSELLSMAISLLALSIGGDILMIAAQGIASHIRNLSFFDFYQTLYGMTRLTFVDHVANIVMVFTLLSGTFLLGMFISLLFYRLDKMWTLIVAIGTPVMIFIGFPLLHGYIPFVQSIADRVFIFVFNDCISKSPWLFALLNIIGSGIIGTIDWLIMRRAPIKAAGK